MYAADNDSCLPWANPPIPAPSNWWYTSIGKYVESGSTIKSVKGVWTCPATKNNYWLGYGWNYSGLGYTNSVKGPTRLGTGKDLLVMVVDTKFAETKYAGGTTDGSGTVAGPTGYGGNPDLLPKGVHNLGQNVLFVDGHVQWYPIQGLTSGLYDLPGTGLWY